MTKGEALSPEDAALQEKRPQDHKPSNLCAASETAEEFLCNIHLWLIWITLVMDYLWDLELSLIPEPQWLPALFQPHCCVIFFFYFNV